MQFSDIKTMGNTKVPPGFHGKKGRSGRKRNPRNVLKYFNDQIDLNSYALVDITIQKALDGDKEMIMYCWDRRLGKAKATTDLNVDTGKGLTQAMFLMLINEGAKAEKAFQEGKPTPLLEAGEPDATEQSTE